jgi:hypothetical protein
VAGGIDDEPIWLFVLGFADELVGDETFERLESLPWL